jgi:hypothetical protein
MQISKNFILQELVPQKTFEEQKDSAVFLIDPRLINAIQFVRDYFDVSATINNWHTGGEFQFSGYRYKGCGVGKEKGDHYNGTAADLKLEGKDSLVVQKEIIANKKLFKSVGITGIEKDTKGWTHISVNKRLLLPGDDIFLIPIS